MPSIPTTTPTPVTTAAPVATPVTPVQPTSVSTTTTPAVTTPQTTTPVSTPATDTSASPDAATSAEDQVAQSLGYKSYADALGQLTAAPTQSETDLYNSAYSAAGLDTLSNTISGRQSDLATAQGNINDNPWLDEADRVGRNRTVTTLANADIKNYQDEYNAKLKEVQDLVTRETADNTQNTAANKTKLAALESQAKALAAQTAATTKAQSAAPKTIKGASGATYKWNPTTSTFDQILPGKNTSTPTTKPFAFTPKQLTALQSQGLDSSSANGILSDIKSGQSLQAIRQQMTSSGLDPKLLDSLMYYVDPAHNTPAKAASSTTPITL